MFTLRAKLIALFLFFGSCLNAQWSVNPQENNPIATTVDRENSCVIASDGSGGAIIAWWKYIETNNDYDIYAQRIDVDGVVKWAAGGVPICALPSSTHVPYIVSDGNGGAIIAWFDSRNSNKNEIFLQKINSSGIVQWTANGVSVGTVAEHHQQGSPHLTTDGSGGAIVAWQDWRKPEGTDVISIYAQRVSSSGAIMWGTGGAQVTNQKLSNLSIASDNNGGAIVAWDLYLNDTRRDVYIQRISPSGSQLWTANGVPVCTLNNYKAYPKSVADNTGGAIVIWEDNRINSRTNIYAQKFSSAGEIQWVVNGVPAIYNTSYSYRFYSIVSDGNNGAYIAAKNASNNTSVVQRINSSGEPQWNADGIGLGGCNEEPVLIKTGTDMVVAWSKDAGSGDIYAQKYNSAGDVQWGASGVGVSTPQFSSQYSPDIAPGANGDVIIVWDDYRNNLTLSTDVYTQKVSANGSLGLSTLVRDPESDPVSDFIIYQNYPNPFRESTDIKFMINKPGRYALKVFSIDGRLISTLIDNRMEPGNYSMQFSSGNLPEGLLYYQMTCGHSIRTKYMVHVK
jgi:hypothetical protein